jgi:uncharacterized membrane protein YphA (DoxX/SURF4 family)/uncharacterized membrane protein YhaH (DUF805 family)
MRYSVWFVRLLFAAWMIPAGVNHFVRIFPQPMGSQPLSHELIVALIDSHLFDIVKAVELVAGLGVLIGLHAPLAVLICLPVSFCVFYWDAPLEGWGSRAALFGYSALIANLLLCIAYVRSYASMFALRVRPEDSRRLFLAGRVLFGAWLLASGINHFFLPLWAEPAGHTPLAVQLLDAFRHSRLLDVAMAIELVAGALILIGCFVPVALCVVMPVSTCALYWSVVLEHRPLVAVLALAAFALNGLLMLACLNYYKGALQRYALTLGETPQHLSFDALFASPGGRTPRRPFVKALLTLLAAVAFYVFLVTGRTAHWCALVLLFSGLMLHAPRLRDMGRSAWLLLVPAALMIWAFAIWLGYTNAEGSLQSLVPPVALLVSAGFALWGCIAGSQPGSTARPS